MTQKIVFQYTKRMFDQHNLECEPTKISCCNNETANFLLVHHARPEINFSHCISINHVKKTFSSVSIIITAGIDQSAPS